MITASFACNEPSTGHFAGIITAVQLEWFDDEITISGRDLTLVHGGDTVTVDGHTFECCGWRDAVGNWCWSATQMTKAESRELLRHLLNAGWQVDSTTAGSPWTGVVRQASALAQHGTKPRQLSGRRIYVASSPHNQRHPAVVRALREAGHEVFDPRAPSDGAGLFRWVDIDPDGRMFRTGAALRDALDHPLAQGAATRQASALEWADTVVLVQPTTRDHSAYIELGWACGSGRDAWVLMSNGHPPELGVLLAGTTARLCLGLDELLTRLSAFDLPGGPTPRPFVPCTVARARLTWLAVEQILVFAGGRDNWASLAKAARELGATVLVANRQDWPHSALSGLPTLALSSLEGGAFALSLLQAIHPLVGHVGTLRYLLDQRGTTPQQECRRGLVADEWRFWNVLPRLHADDAMAPRLAQHARAVLLVGHQSRAQEVREAVPELRIICLETVSGATLRTLLRGHRRPVFVDLDALHYLVALHAMEVG